MRSPLTLRARLMLFFIGIVVVPLVVAGLVVQRLAVRQVETRTDSTLRSAAPGLRVAIIDRVDRAEIVTRLVAVRAVRVADDGASLDPLREESGLDYLVVVRRGSAVAASLRPNLRFLEGVTVRPSDLAVGRPQPGLVAGARIALDTDASTEVRGGFFLDRRFLNSLPVLAATVRDGRVIASRVTPVPAVRTGAAGAFDAGPGLRGLFVPFEDEPRSGLLALVRRDQGGPLSGAGDEILLLLAVGVAMATALGYGLARLIASPLQRLTSTALAVAGGDLEQTVPAEGRDDVARLGAAFNQMTTNLRRSIGELTRSRDELRRSLDRLGTTLSAAHDVDDLLCAVLKTAGATLGSTAGVAYLRPPRRRELRSRAVVGFKGRVKLRVGEGVAGYAVAEAQPLLVGPDDRGRLAPEEPAVDTAIAVPLSSGGRVIGSIALYGRREGFQFTQEDLGTLASLAAQASIAIENVHLQEEAQRMAVTDDLTGVWNRRYLQDALARELGRSERYERPFSLLVLDIDHFKAVNDRFGHARGDQVLIELCRRVRGSIRSSVDVLARYGGEEFVIVLPETGRAGALTAAEKVRSVVHDEPFTAGGEAIPVTVSVGVATFPGDGADADVLFRAADRALYRAKRAGRDRVAAAGARATRTV